MCIRDRFRYDNEAKRIKMQNSRCTVDRLNIKNHIKTPILSTSHFHYYEEFETIAAPEIAKILFKSRNINTSFEYVVNSRKFISTLNPVKNTLLIENKN